MDPRPDEDSSSPNPDAERNLDANGDRSTTTNEDRIDGDARAPHRTRRERPHPLAISSVTSTRPPARSATRRAPTRTRRTGRALSRARERGRRFVRKNPPPRLVSFVRSSSPRLSATSRVRRRDGRGRTSGRSCGYASVGVRGGGRARLDDAQDPSSSARIRSPATFAAPPRCTTPPRGATRDVSRAIAEVIAETRRTNAPRGGEAPRRCRAPR